MAKKTPAKPEVSAKERSKAKSKAAGASRTTVAKAATKKPAVKSAPKPKPEETTAKTKSAKADVPPPAKKPVVEKEPQTISRGKPKLLPREFLSALADAIKTAVLPSVIAAKGREVIGSASSGDATFQIDKIAEKALLGFLREAKLPVAYYSEDAGYTTFTNAQPESLLVVDPIDGTRAAKSGFESCVVAIAATRVIERPRIADVDSALVMEIIGSRTFYAERGHGAKIYLDGQYKKPKLSNNADLETVSWSMTVPGRPAELIFPTAAKLIDLTSLKGGFFACNSTSFSLTRLLTNQLDACVDLANRYMRDIPEVVRDQFINAGRGSILGIAPYDIAASLLIAQEAGCTVTDAYGEGFDEVMLLDSAAGNHRSMIAAANKELHASLLKFFDTRIQQYERLLKRRAAQG